MEPLVVARGLAVRAGRHVVLRDVDLDLWPGDFACFRGRSGSGKTSLMATIALARTPAGGRLVVAGLEAGSQRAARLRSRLIGYIPQERLVVWELLVWENIALPLLASGDDRAREKARAAASLLEIDGLLDMYPSELSGGQLQRVLIARALVRDPLVIVADEAISGLDEALVERVYGILSEAAARGRLVVYATPDSREPAPCTREFRVAGGRVVES